MHLSGSIDFTILRHRSCTPPSHHQNTDFGAYITDSRRSEVKLRKHGKNRDKTETYGESNGEKGRVSVSYLRRFCSLLPRLSNFLILLLLGVLYQPKNETQQSLRSSEGYFWLLYLEHISESLLSYFYLSKESWIRASTFFFFTRVFSHTHLYFYLSERVYFCRLRNSSTKCKILGWPALSITSAFLCSLSERQIMKKGVNRKKKVGCMLNKKVGLYLTPNTVHRTAGHFLVHGAR